MAAFASPSLITSSCCFRRKKLEQQNVQHQEQLRSVAQEHQEELVMQQAKGEEELAMQRVEMRKANAVHTAEVTLSQSLSRCLTPTLCLMCTWREVTRMKAKHSETLAEVEGSFRARLEEQQRMHEEQLRTMHEGQLQMQQLENRKAAEARRMHDKEMQLVPLPHTAAMKIEISEEQCHELSCLLLTAFCQLRDSRATEVGELKARIEKVRMCTHCYNIHPLHSNYLCTDSPGSSRQGRRGQCDFAGNPCGKGD